MHCLLGKSISIKIELLSISVFVKQQETHLMQVASIPEAFKRHDSDRFLLLLPSILLLICSQ